MEKIKEDCLIFPGRIPPKEICFVNSIGDDHEGLAVMRTVDPVEGRMEFWVPACLAEDFMAFIRFLREEFGIPVEVYDPIPCTSEFETLY